MTVGRLDKVVVRGIPIFVRANTWDKGIAHEVIQGDCYRVAGWKPKDDAVVFDVGGHIGSFSRWIGKRFPRVRIFAFEMDADNQVVFEKNTAELPNVKLTKAALGHRSGSVTRSRCTEARNTGGSGVFWDSQEGDTVPSVSIADFLRDNRIEHIDLLKLDCEGSEFVILDQIAGLPGGLSRIGAIRAEVHALEDDPRLERFRNLLKSEFQHIEEKKNSPGLRMMHAWR